MGIGAVGPRYLIDGFDLGRNRKGIDRVLKSLVPLLRAADAGVVVVTTSAGVPYIGETGSDPIIVRATKKSVWEQWGLPRVARNCGCHSVYSHREAGALWGPPLVLHIPEDPQVRWSRERPRGFNGSARLAYSRALLRRSVHRAAIVAASVDAVGNDIGRRFGRRDVVTIPLGVDHDVFTPASEPFEDSIFHLGSADPRDRTLWVLRAYLAAVERLPLPPLVIAGALGPGLEREVAQELACAPGTPLVQVVGWLSDAALVDRYRNALVVVQPAADEGFGLQPLEALACGAPLVATANPAVSEVVADAAELVPERIDALSEAIVKLASSDERRTELRQLGPISSARFTWQSSAEHVFANLRLAAERGALPRGAHGPASA